MTFNVVFLRLDVLFEITVGELVVESPYKESDALAEWLNAYVLGPHGEELLTTISIIILTLMLILTLYDCNIT